MIKGDISDKKLYILIMQDGGAEGGGGGHERRGGRGLHTRCKTNEKIINKKNAQCDTWIFLCTMKWLSQPQTS